MSRSKAAVGQEPQRAVQVNRVRETLAGLAASGDESDVATMDALMMDGAVQELMTASVHLYAACLELDPHVPAFGPTAGRPTPTEVLMTVSAMLEAVEVAPFELGLWATWGIRGGARSGEDKR